MSTSSSFSSKSRGSHLSRLAAALEEGAWGRLELLAQHGPMPRKQAKRIRLWQAALAESPDRVEHTLRGWAWLRSHKMTLDATSMGVVLEHTMKKAPAASLARFLDDLIPKGKEAQPILGYDGAPLRFDAIRRPDTEGLQWLLDRGEDLDPPDAFPTLQRVLEIKEIQPATVRIIRWMLDHGIQVRRIAPSIENPYQDASPLGILVNLAWHRDLADHAVLAQVQQLWLLLEAAGDDPRASATAGSPLAQLDRVPVLKQWHDARGAALLRQAQAEPLTSPTRRRIRP